MPWLLWNFLKQDHPARELVVVDSSREPWTAPSGGAIRVVRTPPGTGIAAKRNLAVAEARGAIIAWFDDDDWQHPRRLSLLLSALAPGSAIAGTCSSWFVDLGRGRARPFTAQRHPLFNALAVRRSVASAVHFDERLTRAADTPWVAAVCRDRAQMLSDVLTFWLCHGDNVSNPVWRHRYPYPLSAVADAVGPEAWGETDERLSDLRHALNQLTNPH